MLFEFLNRKLKRHCLESSCIIIFGDRGCGKSSTLALICEQALKAERMVFCQYPYQGAVRIPLVRRQLKTGMDLFDIDKDWLYNTAFPKGSVILIDEASTIWPARNFKSWNESDSAFFNFIRKEGLTLVLATQYWDQLDLNVKRSASEAWFESSSLIFPNLTVIETSTTTTVKVADKQTEVIGRAFKRGARKIAFDVCEIPKRTYRLYRKPYYGQFVSEFVPFKKKERPFEKWDDLHIFE